MGTWKTPEQVASEVLDEAEARWGGDLRHEVTSADPDVTEKHECLAMIAALEKLGWMRLGTARSPLRFGRRRAVLRILVAPGGSAVATVSWRIRRESLFFWQEQGATCEIVTPLADGRLLVTSNAGEGPHLMPSPDGISVTSLKTEAGPRRVADLHARRLRLAEAGGSAAEPVTGLTHAVAVLDRMLEREAAMRRAFGLVSTAEVLWRDADPPHARALEAEKRRRRRHDGSHWHPLPLADALALLLRARGRAVESALSSLLDALAEAGPGPAREAVARAGGADELLLHVYEQARSRGSDGTWPSWDAEELRSALWKHVRDRPRAMAALLRVPSRSAAFDALELLQKAGRTAQTAAREALAECLRLDPILRDQAGEMLARVIRADGGDDLVPYLRGEHGTDGVRGALEVVLAAGLSRHVPEVREAVAREEGNTAFRACEVLHELAPNDPAILPALARVWRGLNDEDGHRPRAGWPASASDHSAAQRAGGFLDRGWRSCGARADVLSLVSDVAASDPTLALRLLRAGVEPGEIEHASRCDDPDWCFWCSLPDVIEVVEALAREAPPP
jgi:hypothetical protein